MTFTYYILECGHIKWNGRVFVQWSFSFFFISLGLRPTTTAARCRLKLSSATVHYFAQLSFTSFHISFAPLIMKGNIGYDILSWIFNIMVDIFFREVRPRGAHRIPKEGPVIFVAAPHANQVSRYDMTFFSSMYMSLTITDFLILHHILVRRSIDCYARVRKTCVVYYCCKIYERKRNWHVCSTFEF